MKYFLIQQYKSIISALGFSKVNHKNKALVAEKPKLKHENIEIHTLAPGLIFKNKLGKNVKVNDCFFSIKQF